MQRPLGAQMSHMLKDRGVAVIFGIPGMHNQELYRGIEEAGLRHVLARHEQGAGFMADGYARATGRPAVCYVITGPGLCNIMTPMGQAYSDSVPMLVISSCLDDTAAIKGQLHQMRDQEAAARTVCDWSETARTADAAYALIDRALVEFKANRPAPKCVTVPISVLEQVAGPAPVNIALSRPDMHRTLLPSETDVSDLAHRIARARRPLFVFGGGCLRESAVPVEEQVRALVAQTGAAAFTTYAGRGLLAPDDPLSFGAYLARPSSADVFAQADLLVVFGSQMSEVDLWRRFCGHDCPVVRVDIDPVALGSLAHTQSMIRSDAMAVITALLDHFPDPRQPKWDREMTAGFCTRMRAEIAAERPGIMPVADALRDALPPDTMIYSDMTQFAYAALEGWPMARPGHWHHPHGFGTLGFALPAAIGGKIGRPELPVIAIAGDYGFQYTLQELMVAVELDLSLPIIVWDNGKLGEIEAGMIRAQIAPNAVVQRNPDFVKLADAYGAAAARPETLGGLQQSVRSALARKGPTLIHVTSDIRTG